MGLFDIFKKKQDESTTTTILDYSTIDSKEKAQKLFAKGKLVKLYLMPLDFGGQDSPINTLFVPEFANNQKNNFDSKISDMLESGLKLGYSASPEYKGSSFIPGRLIIDVKGDTTITEVIDIW
jgi:hypothetical protein